MSCEIFAKIPKDVSSLEDIFSTLREEKIGVVDVSAKPSLDSQHYFLRLTLESDQNTVARIFSNDARLSGVSIS